MARIFRGGAGRRQEVSDFPAAGELAELALSGVFAMLWKSMSQSFPLARFRCLLIPAAVSLALVLWSIPSALMVKKVVGMLVMPTGWIWLGLMAIAGCPGMTAWARRFAVMVLIVYTLAGNAWLGGFRPAGAYAAMPRPAQPFDVILVLGGGSSARPDGGSRARSVWRPVDRPGKIVSRGQDRTSVASGLNVTDIGGSRSFADDTAGLWWGIGIPETSRSPACPSLARRRRKSVHQDTDRIRSWTAGRRVFVRLAPAAGRRKICRAEGVVMVPFRGFPVRLRCHGCRCMPCPARGFQNVQKAVWEYLGADGRVIFRVVQDFSPARLYPKMKKGPKSRLLGDQPRLATEPGFLALGVLAGGGVDEFLAGGAVDLAG